MADEQQVTPNQQTQTDPGATEQQQVVSTSAPQQQTTPPVEDLVTRASRVSLDDDKPKAESDVLEGSGFDRNQFNAMLDKLPADQRAQVESLQSSLQRGANVKFQKAADMLKQAEASGPQPWTLDRIQTLSNDPGFVQAAQQYAQLTQPQPTGSANDYSDPIEQPDPKVQQLTMDQKVLQSKLDNIMLSQQDDQLRQTYKNYDSGVVNQIRNDLLSGRMKATSEHLWMVHDYHPAIKRAYKLGQQDRKLDLQEKQNASSVGIGGINATPMGEVPKKQPNETNLSLFHRLYAKRKAEFQQAQQK